MLVYKCSCGKVLMSEENDAGNTVACPYCRQNLVVPAESAPDCNLVFFEGAPEQGVPMDDSELQEAVISGRVTPYDLIFHEGQWQQLRNVFDMSDIEQVSAADPNEQEIATQFGELQPLPGYDKLKGHKKAPLPQALDEAAQRAAVKKRNIINHVKLVLKIAVVLIILVFGAERGMRIVNFTLHKPASVLLINNYDFAVEFKVGGSDWSVAYPGNMGTISDLATGFLPQLMRLRVSPDYSLPEGQTANLGKTWLFVPVKANQDIVVNLNGQMELGVYDLKDIETEEVPIGGGEISRMQNDMNALKPPQAFMDFVKSLQKIGKKRFIRKHKDVFSSSEKYNLGHTSVPVSRSILDLTPAEEEAREKTHAQAPWLTIPAQCRLDLKGRSHFVYAPPEGDSDGDSPEGEIEIPFPKLKFLPDLPDNKRPALLQYNLDSQGAYNLHVTIMDLPFTDEIGQKVYIRWHYYAKRTKSGQWTYHWEGIYPYYDEKGTHKSRKITINSDGKVTRSPEQPEKNYPDPMTRKKK